ncbi:Long-chain acyl-CoA synthetase (AMP-forming) [Onishia taeanensis]|uniref:Long-chain acyl-CoA synthetase (AMP-forming) n=1 Tax=Onishia taeanensis TaxID=284577 RepID=A0A1G7V0B3_9GAMM|nr:AMP-binding protein [Halomonas taeanensis]SDG53272.1 Long-chain acyl-CoA synthetase (AMP-forming) [Halomonas taeanensis]
MSAERKRFLAAVANHARTWPDRIALNDGKARLSYAELLAEVDRRRERLAALDARRVGLALDNGLDWALWDLALLCDERVAVPVPGFFSPSQRKHLVASAGLDSWIGTLEEAAALGFAPSDDSAIAFRTVSQPPELHAGTAKITFTSGTSGAPKGVCLDNAAMLRVAESIASLVAPLDIRRHLAMLPLATLLENIGGLYVPLWLGASCHLPGTATLGWQGASGFCPRTAMSVIESVKPQSLILVPQLLQALLAAAPEAPESLSFVAAGGARLAPALLAQAEERGWPVFEGYGLSECASVVCLNRPGEPAHGAGRPLPHAKVRLSADGDVEISGATMLGYLGEAPIGGWYSSGDLGRLVSYPDGERLHLDGRRREVFITAYGRNVDPQWVESELTLQPMIAQALVHGEALDHNRALIVPRDPSSDDASLAAAISAANARLPDYARVHAWRRAAPFTPANDQLTANGRLRRTSVFEAYRDWLTAEAESAATPSFDTTGAAS